MLALFAHNIVYRRAITLKVPLNTAIEENGQVKRVRGVCVRWHTHTIPSGPRTKKKRGYNTATAPTNIVSETKQAESTAAVFGSRACTADEDPKVATNWAVGFGPPLMVTVGWEDKTLAEELPVSLVMENACDVAYMTPCVLLRKRRK